MPSPIEGNDLAHGSHLPPARMKLPDLKTCSDICSAEQWPQARGGIVQCDRVLTSGKTPSTEAGPNADFIYRSEGLWAIPPQTRFIAACLRGTSARRERGGHFGCDRCKGAEGHKGVGQPAGSPSALLAVWTPRQKQAQDLYEGHMAPARASPSFERCDLSARHEVRRQSDLPPAPCGRSGLIGRLRLALSAQRGPIPLHRLGSRA